jgi:cytoskeletal protein RodZ
MTDHDNTLANEEPTYVKEAIQCEVGLKLQQARKNKGLSKAHVLKELKFNSEYLDALESGNWAELPGDVYALGFLKQYASLVDLDISQDIDRIKSSSFEMIIPLTFPDEKISPHRTWVIVAVTVFFIIIIMFNKSEPENNLHDAGEITKEEQAVTDTYSVAEPSLNTYQQTNPLSLDEEIKPIEAIEKTIKPQAPSVMEITEKVVSPQAPSVMEASYSFYASANDVWLQVFKVKGAEQPELLKEALLRKGQKLTITSADKLLLTAGNSRALEVSINGKVSFAVDTLGREGRVLKRFPISP